MDAEELTQRARDCQGWLPVPLATLIVELGHAEELPRQVARGDWHSARAWAEVLAGRGEHASALEVLAPFAATGWWEAAETVAKLLDGWDRTDEAIALVEPFAAAGDRLAITRLAHLLVRAGRHDEAFALLRPRADDVLMARTLAKKLTGCGHDAEITAILEDIVEKSADAFVVGDLATLYEGQERVDDAVALLRAHLYRNGSCQVNHVEQLADLLARHDRIAELAEMAAGSADEEAAPRPIGGQAAPGPARERAALRLAAWHAADGEPGRSLDVLHPFVEQGSTRSAAAMASVLAAIDWIDAAAEVLRPFAEQEGAYPYSAAPVYFELLAENGRHDEALALIDSIAGPEDTPEELVWYRADLLRGAGRAEEALGWLRGRPDAAAGWIRKIIVEQLSELGRDGEVIALLDRCEGRDELIAAARALIRLGRVTEAVELVHAWREPPAGGLTSLWGR